MSAMDDAATRDRTHAPGRDHPDPGRIASASPAPEWGTPSGPQRLGAAPPRAPEETSAWLHVVSGPTVPALSRAVFELAARFLAGGHRVLILDGAPRLRLHQRFDRESRWGMVECLGRGLPVLGLVQDSGRLGLYLLAHGAPGGTVAWPGIARVLEDVRPHFGRAILAVDPDAPAAVGEALAGAHLEGWWPQGGSEARRAAGIGGRLGIPFGELDLEAMLQPRLEALDARLWHLVAPPPPAEVPGAEPVEAVAAAPAEPVSLDSDPGVRERLRFLLWMRRVETEGRAVPTGASPPAEREES
jgi:hypothetical protein